MDSFLARMEMDQLRSCPAYLTLDPPQRRQLEQLRSRVLSRLRKRRSRCRVAGTATLTAVYGESELPAAAAAGDRNDDDADDHDDHEGETEKGNEFQEGSNPCNASVPAPSIPVVQT
jgi:hypothetical protein